MEVRLTHTSWNEIECDLLVIPLFEDEGLDEEFISGLDQGLGGLLSELRETEEWLGKRHQCTIVHRPQGVSARRLALLGAGKKASWDSEAVRRTVTRAIGQVKGYKLRRVAVGVRSERDDAAAAQATAEGVVLAAYSADEYKTAGKSKTLIEEVPPGPRARGRCAAARRSGSSWSDPGRGHQPGALSRQPARKSDQSESIGGEVAGGSGEGRPQGRNPW